METFLQIYVFVSAAAGLIALLLLQFLFDFPPVGTIASVLLILVIGFIGIPILVCMLIYAFFNRKRLIPKELRK